MNLLAELKQSVRSGWPTISIDEWISWFNYGGNSYPLGLRQTLSGNREEIAEDFVGYVQSVYKRNGVVFACMLVRLMLFSEARFAFREWDDQGRPGRLFVNQELKQLQRPWPNGTTGDLLARMIQDADLAGNFFATERRGRIKRMRPDWVAMVLGTELTPGQVKEAAVEGDLDADVVGYLYTPGGPTSNSEPQLLMPPAERVAHFAPIPDPLASFRGMSWLTPVLREVAGDNAATTHKLKFFENGATPNMVVSLDINDPDKFQAFVDKMDEAHKGVLNAYKTLYVGAGATPTVVGSHMKQMDFKATQGVGETRIAAAAGVPAVIVGISEGLQGSSLNAGNYGQARRRLADGTLSPLWRSAAGSMASLVREPADAHLWTDTRDIPFLREDEKDTAEILKLQAETVRQLTDAGFKPESVVDAVEAGDLSRLEHSGLFSVQLQQPGTGQDGGSE